MNSELFLSLFLGLGLSAAAGFRVFLPLLALSIGAHFGFIPLGESWQWAGSSPALITLSIAVLLEIGAYYIPWLDNILDTLAVPLAAIAGTAMVAAVAVDLNPLLTWSLAIIAGGGTAGAIKSANAGTRMLSSATTAGLGNPIVSTAETGASLTMIAISFLLPPLAILIVLVILYFVSKAFLAFRSKQKV